MDAAAMTDLLGLIDSVLVVLLTGTGIGLSSFGSVEDSVVGFLVGTDLMAALPKMDAIDLTDFFGSVGSGVLCFATGGGTEDVGFLRGKAYAGTDFSTGD